MIIHKNIDLRQYNTLRISYVAECMFEIENAVEIYILLYIFKEFNLEYIVIGNGSKILFKDYYIRKPIIYINISFSELEINEDNVIVSSGFLLSNLILNLANNNYGGFEKLFPIPGTIGGIIYMNGGIKEYSISNFVRYIIYIDDNLNIKKISNNECLFEYRESFFKNKKYVILYVCLNINNLTKELIFNNIQKSILYRKNHQEYNKNTIGSLFKNPKNNFAFEMIKETFPNSIRINGAYISKKHSNFLICENATNEDVLLLIERIKESVFNKYKYLLELELNIL